MSRKPYQRAVLHAAVVLASFSVFYSLFFSPALLDGLLLALRDGQNQYLPTFVSPVTLWNDLIFGGFPMAADPQAQSWYPVARFFSLIPGSWNAFVISAYVLAGSLAYGYIHALTGSRLAGVVGGLTYGTCGFMMGHVPHAAITHAAAWLPLVIWSLHEVRRNRSAAWIAAGGAGVALTALGGHPQILVYGLALAGAYALVIGWSGEPPRKRYFAGAASVFILGLGLAAIQLIPTLELSSLGTRWNIDFWMFSTVSMPPRQRLMLLFPYAFGGAWQSPYRTEYFGAENQNELSGYVGLLPLVLAAVGIWANRRSAVAWFWVAVAALTIPLAWGTETPLGRLLYHIPVYNKFRAPSRHLIEFALAVSALSGLGVAAVKQRATERRKIRALLLTAGGILAFVLAALIVLIQRSELGVSLQGPQAHASIPRHPALFVPVLVLLGSVAALGVWSARPRSRWRQGLLIAALSADLGSFGFFYEWRYLSPRPADLAAGPHVKRYREWLQESGQRVLSERGATGFVSEFRVNLSQVWGVRSAGGYNQLMPERLSQFYPMDVYGVAEDPWADETNRALDLMAVRYVIRPNPERLDEPSGFVPSPPHWQEIERVGDEAVVYENRRAMPRAWMVSEVVRATPSAVLQTIHTSVMPDGSAYDPSRIALVEPPFPLERQKFDPGATVRLTRQEPTELELRTQGRTQGFMVLSDSYYEGWRAWVDGRATPIFRANYVQRGILLPPGNHHVRFRFAPPSFTIGSAFSVASAVLILSILLYEIRTRNRPRAGPVQKGLDRDCRWTQKDRW